MGITPENVAALKNCLDALQRLKEMRRDVKAKMSKEGLAESDEKQLAEELNDIARKIGQLEEFRKGWLRPAEDVPAKRGAPGPGGGGAERGNKK